LNHNFKHQSFKITQFQNIQEMLMTIIRAITE